jgi:hypothetical protein
MKEYLNNKVIQTMITVASIGTATIWIEDRIGGRIENALEPVNARVTILEQKVKTLEDKVLIYTFKVDAYETYFTKPKETKLENE